jgi:hypothetical protein
MCDFGRNAFHFEGLSTDGTHLRALCQQYVVDHTTAVQATNGFVARRLVQVELNNSQNKRPSVANVSCERQPVVCTAQHSTAQHSTAQHSTAQHSTALHCEYREYYREY